MSQQNILQEPISKIDFLMWRFFKLFFKNKKQLLEKLGLTCSQFEILSAMHYLQEIQPEIIQVDLSEKTAIDPMTTSTILRNLQKKGLITRQRSTVNTRAIIVRFTIAGVELLEEAYRQVKEQDDLIYNEIDREYLVSLLTKLSDKLTKLNY